MKHFSFLMIIAALGLSFMITDQPTGLSVGDTAPEFTGINQQGKKIQLSELVKSGSVVILFYRGEWCPYCNKQLKNLQDSLQLITDKGASVVAISPENSHNRNLTIEKTKAEFNLISDEHSQIMKNYKVAYEMDAGTREKYKGYGIVLTERNGSNGNELPVPAVYIINRQGKITYRFFDQDYTKRASVQELVNHLN